MGSKSPPVSLDLGGFGESERILDINAEVPHGALNLRMSEQDLHGPQVAGLLVDHRGLGSAERVRPVILPTPSDSGDPFVHERAYWRVLMSDAIDPAREGERSSAF